MRTRLVIISLLAAAVSAVAADADRPRLELYRAGPKELAPQSEATVVGWTETFLKSANFNTANQPEILKQSITAIHERYRTTIRADCFIVSYARPMKFKTIAGDVTVVEIIVGLNRPDSIASALFTVDPDGRLIAHEKYAAMTLPAELAPEAPACDAAAM